LQWVEDFHLADDASHDYDTALTLHIFPSTAALDTTFRSDADNT
jgi:hypothetical protein